MTTKRCYSCHVEQDASEFHKDKCRPDGLNNRCKSCERKRVHKRVVANFNPWLPAQQALRAAVRYGRVVKWPACANPGCTRTDVQAHHPDYSRPLDVVWLCPYCHKHAHRAHLKPAPKKIGRVKSVEREGSGWIARSPYTGEEIRPNHRWTSRDDAREAVHEVRALHDARSFQDA